MSYLRVIAWAAAFLLNVGLLAGIKAAPFLDYALRGEELPQPFVRHRIEFYPWAVNRLLAPTVIGRTEREVQALFGDRYLLPSARGVERCLSFRQGMQPAVTVLFRHGRAHAVWVEPDGRPSTACPEILNRDQPIFLPWY